MLTVGMPGMLRVNVTAAPDSACPSGSVTVAVRVTGSGSFECLMVYGEALSATVSLPVPRLTLTLACAVLPAGSVPVTVIAFTPGASATLSVNVPSDSAVPATDEPFASFRASSVVRAWVLPLMVTALPLMTALFLGEVMVILGGASSNT